MPPPSTRTLEKFGDKNRRRRKTKQAKRAELPPEYDWRGSDQDELLKRGQRAKTERILIPQLDSEHPIFGNYTIASESGLEHEAEIRGTNEGEAACSCPDFRQTGLGACKHVEAALGTVSYRRALPQILRPTDS